MRSRLLVRVGLHCVVHGLLAIDGEPFAILVVRRSNCMVLLNHDIVRLYMMGDLLRTATFAGLGLVFVSVFEQLKAIANLGLVEAVRVIRWLSGTSYSLLTWTSG